mmetsp:Transcript_17486/g.38253  ORF Transcript_17486/g.38253 Transcript_17486/m.38253 type:complete len:551 (-) Transcript_17486:139-1791(-)
MYNPIQSSNNTDADDRISVPEQNISPFNIGTDENDEGGHDDSSAERLIMPLGTLQRSRRWLYLAHFFSLFSEDYWQFSVVLFLSVISDFQSMLYISTFGLSLNVGIFFVTPCLGKWIDRRPAGEKLRVTQLVLAGKHVTIILLAVLSSCILRIAIPLPQSGGDDSSSSSSDNGFENMSVAGMVVLTGIYVFGTVAKILDRTFNIIIERDLVVVLSECADDAGQPQSGWLSKTNTAMEQISLLAKVLISFLIFEKNYQYTCLVVGIVSAIAWAVQYLCITRMFLLIPILEKRKDDSSHIEKINLADTMCAESEEDFEEEENITTQRSRWPIIVYLEQPSAPAGLSVALLYSNCITFGNGMLSAYLLNRHIQARTIGVLRGVSSAVGLLGTFVYGFSLRLSSLETTGLWGVASQATFLGIAAVFLSFDHNEDTPSNDIILHLFILSVISSRLGLWVFGIAVTQLQQQETPEKYHCLVGGVQTALDALLNLVANAIGIRFTHPDDFIYIATSGFISVALAFVIFFCGVFLPRGNATRALKLQSNIEHSTTSLT